MINMSCFRIFKFDAAHRISGKYYEGLCSNIHGHSYKLKAFATPKTKETTSSTTTGMMIDFSILKSILGGWIDMNLDHSTIISDEDKDMIDRISCDKQKIYILERNNSTVENLAQHILCDICPVLFQDSEIIVNRIDLWETENCGVTVSIDKPTSHSSNIVYSKINYSLKENPNN